MEYSEIHTGTLSPERIADVLRTTESAFKAIGPTIVEQAGNVASYNDKADGSPVTDVDVEVENALKAEIARRTGIPVYGEEGGYDDKQTKGTFWLLDPIDGTKDFIENVPGFTTMGVLIQDNEAVAAAIYDPLARDMYSALKGKGAYKNGERLDLQDLDLPQIAWCKEQFIEEINGMLLPKGVTCKKPPRGGGYGFAKVAEGLSAARFNLHGGGYTHDYAPGALLVREAGGVIIPVLEDEYNYMTRSFVACHPDLAAVVRPHVARLRELELAKKRR